MNIFNELESQVQCYARSFPVVFERATGSTIVDAEGNEYLDFLAGAGSLNYGHNNPVMKAALIDYIKEDGITHSLDLHTKQKEKFLTAFNDYILKPRKLNYRVQFTGPTGTNAVEAALKIARKVTGRQNVIAFTNGFHGVSLGALALTGNQHHRGAAGVPLENVIRMPFAGYYGKETNTIQQIEKLFADQSSGIELPAAIILETVQGEGGLNVASVEWLKAVEALCRKYKVLLIVDDIQAGCGRTGTFFSFEPAGIKPDIVTLSKSLSGYGLPLAVTLIKPDYDQWEPGEHNGTFRGNNHAFLTAEVAIRHYWKDDSFAEEIQRKSSLISQQLKRILLEKGAPFMKVCGRGLMQGIDCRKGDLASLITESAFKRGLMIETGGSEGQVVKCLCPLTITDEEIKKALKILAESIEVSLQIHLKKVS